jgi:hypothetical protein
MVMLCSYISYWLAFNTLMEVDPNFTKSQKIPTSLIVIFSVQVLLCYLVASFIFEPVSFEILATIFGAVYPVIRTTFAVNELEKEEDIEDLDMRMVYVTLLPFGIGSLITGLLIFRD